MTEGQPGVNLEFRDVCYERRDAKGCIKRVLHHVSGDLRCGRLTAIMGPSGAGKTSLLNVLSGFKTKGVSGSVKVNGIERDVDLFRAQSCYITQDHSLLPQLTARETLTIAASLKLEAGWTQNPATSSIVSQIFELLGLTASEETSVQHLSGGERKRLSIGLELITNPPVMFFDEPTSGLDSSSSVQVMSHLSTLAATGRTVVCVIHQPSSHVYQMFDDLYLLAGGRCLYAGSTGNMVKVFEDAGFNCPDYYNRADYAIEVACGERGEDLSGLLQIFNTCRDSDHDICEDDRHISEITAMIPPVNDVISSEISHKVRRYPTSQLQQFIVLLNRAGKCAFRDMHLAQIRLACHIAVALLLGLIYYDVGNEASKVDSNAACMFFFLMFLFFSNAMPTVLTFPLEMSVFLREHLNNWYSLPSYYSSKLLATLPLQLLCPLVFILISFYLTGQPTDGARILRLLLACQLLGLSAQALGLVLGAACEPQLAVFLVPVTTIPMFLFSGFFLRLSDVPVYLRWLTTVSYFKQSYEAAMLSVYGYNRTMLHCDQPYCRYKDPVKFLDDLGMAEDSFWCDILGLSLWTLLLYCALYLVLMWRVYKSR